MNTKTIKKSNVLIIYFEANTFNNEFNAKLKTVYDNLGKPSDEYPIAYLATLASFACELYIKFLYAVDQIKSNPQSCCIDVIRGHDLHFLLNQLNEKDEIVKSPLLCDYDVDKMLSENSNDFEIWRYIYEKTDSMRVEIDFLRDFLSALSNHSKDIVNNDNIYFESDNATAFAMDRVKEILQ